jgi:Tfp pilus assembly PilM family ATPase
MLSGYGAVVPGFSEYVSSKVGVQTAIANPWQNVRVTQEDQQQLAPVASQFATVIGLAQRKNKK